MVCVVLCVVCRVCECMCLCGRERGGACVVCVVHVVRVNSVGYSCAHPPSRTLPHTCTLPIIIKKFRMHTHTEHHQSRVEWVRGEWKNGRSDQVHSHNIYTTNPSLSFAPFFLVFSYNLYMMHSHTNTHFFSFSPTFSNSLPLTCQSK